MCLTPFIRNPGIGVCALGLLGSGVQARTHLEAMLQVRPIRSVRVWSRTPERAQAFAEAAGVNGR